MSRIQGVYPIYLPSSSALSKKILMSANRKTLHRGVASTMAAFRSCFWIPILRKLTKSVIQNCYGCKGFRSTHRPNPRPGLLPKDITEQALPFEIMGSDYVGSLCKKDLKAYILLFSCSIIRAVDMELM